MENLMMWVKERKEVVLALLLVLVGGLFFMGRNSGNSHQWILEEESSSLELSAKDESLIEESVEMAATDLYVDIQGAVKAPGVYQLPTGSRLLDAVAAAGGLLPEASKKHLNQAALLEDQMFIYVYQEGEVPDQALPVDGGLENPGASASTSDLININSADLMRLQELPGIGPAKAQAIVSHREEYGSFASLEAIMDVSGIGKKTFESLKDSITY